MARLLALKAVADLTTQPSSVLILCDRIDPDLAFFRAHFIQAAFCLVTNNPDLGAEAPDGIPVICGRLGERHRLRALAAFRGPNLVIDQRTSDPRAQAFAFVVLDRTLAHGGVYALRARTGTRLGYDRYRTLALDRRRASAERLPAASHAGHGPCEYRVTVKASVPPRPIRLRPAADIPASAPVTVAAPTYRRPTATLVDAPPWIVEGVRWFAGMEVVPLEARVHRYPEAIVFGYGIVQVGDSIVAESLINRDRTHLLGALTLASDGTGHVAHTLPRPRRIPGRTVHLWQMWAENYGHWLVECMPRLHVAARAGLLENAKVTVQAIPAMERVYRDSLAVLGIGEARIVWLNAREVVFEDLVYPTPITRQPVEKSPLVIEAALALRDRIGPPAEPLPERIYVSRNRSGRRRLANEAEVIALLRERGYAVVHPETEPFARQVQIFAAARLVVGGMGAALSNLAFSPAGVRCLMLTNQDMLDDFFLDLVGLKDGAYVSIHGTSLSPELGMQSDYTIALDTLRETLDKHDF